MEVQPWVLPPVGRACASSRPRIHDVFDLLDTKKGHKGGGQGRAWAGPGRSWERVNMFKSH